MTYMFIIAFLELPYLFSDGEDDDHGGDYICPVLVTVAYINHIGRCARRDLALPLHSGSVDWLSLAGYEQLLL